MQSPNAQASDVKLVEHVAGSCDGAGTEWRCGGALPRVCQSFNVGENEHQDSHSLRVWVERWMASQNSDLGKRRLFRATAFGRPGVVIVARTCKSKYVSTSSLLFVGKQLSSLGTGAVKRSLWLRVVRLINLAPLFPRARVVDPCDLSQGTESQGEAQATGKTAWVEKAGQQTEL